MVQCNAMTTNEARLTKLMQEGSYSVLTLFLVRAVCLVLPHLLVGPPEGAARPRVLAGHQRPLAPVSNMANVNIFTLLIRYFHLRWSSRMPRWETSVQLSPCGQTTASLSSSLGKLKHQLHNYYQQQWGQRGTLDAAGACTKVIIKVGACWSHLASTEQCYQAQHQAMLPSWKLSWRVSCPASGKLNINIQSF